MTEYVMWQWLSAHTYQSSWLSTRDLHFVLLFPPEIAQHVRKRQAIVTTPRVEVGQTLAVVRDVQNAA